MFIFSNKKKGKKKKRNQLNIFVQVERHIYMCFTVKKLLWGYIFEIKV